MSKYLVILFNLCLSVTCSTQIDTQFSLLQIIYRHGDRTPLDLYPTDPINASEWQKYGGLGQLTQLGMTQHRTFGTYLRNMYSSFLHTEYSKNYHSARSTNFDRTLMSSYSLLSGLFPPDEFQVFDHSLSWQPITVNTTYNPLDSIFYTAPCPRRDELLNIVLKSEERLKMEAKYQDLINLVEQKSGLIKLNMNTIIKTGDTLFVEKSHNLTLPDWAEENYNTIMHLCDLSFYFNYRLPELAKLLAGGILNDMKINIINQIKGTSKKQLFLYGAHDTYIAAMIKLLNISNYINQPPYASAIIIELRNSTDGKKQFVQVYLKNNTANEPITLKSLTIYGCTQLCPLDDFMRIIEDKVVTDFQSACVGKQDQNTLLTKLTFTFIIGIACIAFVLVITAVIFNYRRTLYDNQMHRPLMQYQTVKLIDPDNIDDDF